MWSFIKSAPWTFAIAGLILVGAIVGVVVGVLTKGRWKDYGLLVEDGKKIRWEPHRLPLSVWLEPAMPAWVIDAFNESRAIIQNATGRALFDLGTALPDGFDRDRLMPGHMLLGVHPAAGAQQPDHGVTTLHWDEHGYIVRAYVTLPDELPFNGRTPVMLHELMHVLGFAHDEQRESIMYPRLQQRPQSLTRSDQELLRKLYRKG